MSACFKNACPGVARIINKLEKNKKTKHTEPIIVAGTWEKVESNPNYQAQCTIISTRQIYFPK